MAFQQTDKKGGYLQAKFGAGSFDKVMNTLF